MSPYDKIGQKQHLKPGFLKHAKGIPSLEQLAHLVEHRATVRDLTGSNPPATPTLRVFK